MSDWAKCILVLTLTAAAGVTPSTRQLPGKSPATQGARGPIENPIARLNREIQSGVVRLEFDRQRGYLPSVLKALNVPTESQVMVFSNGSFQGNRIGPTNPRAMFFNDSLVVAWAWGGFLEFAVQDEGDLKFYTLGENAVDAAPFKRRGSSCQGCHAGGFQGPPDMVARSDHRTPIRDRWSGWYVTGKYVPEQHQGNRTALEGEPNAIANGRPPKLESLDRQFDTGKYLSPYSDVVALLVFDHQMQMMNMFLRMGREYRLTLNMKPEQPESESELRETAKELVDYLLFVDEAPLPARIEGASGFAEHFTTLGPRDGQGRSLREFDLKSRLMRYPCSYMIYSQAFESLPEKAKALIYERMWQVLSGVELDPKYARLSRSDRQTIVAVLRDTKSNLPGYFRYVTR
jgi:hypothetical protein